MLWAEVIQFWTPQRAPETCSNRILRENRFGIEIDKDWTGKDCSYDVIQGDLQEIYPLARRIGLTFPVIVANPPFGLNLAGTHH